MFPVSSPARCGACKEGTASPIAFSMAFQPIVDVVRKRVFAYEALVRGPRGESAMSVLEQVTPENQYGFDQGCRVKAIQLASRLGLAETGAALSINFLPGAVYSPAACIQLTLRTARAEGFPLDRLIFELTEVERVKDREHVQAIVREYRQHGFRMALDDFGAGYAGLNLLADLQTHIVKLDMELIRRIEQRPAALLVVQAMVALCGKLGQRVVAEGVETAEEFHELRQCGIELFQGYLLAKPEFERLPEFRVPLEMFPSARATVRVMGQGQEQGAA